MPPEVNTTPSANQPVHVRVLEIIKFLLAGGASAGANMLTFFVLAELLGLWYIFATITSFFMGLGTHFLMQRHVVFPESRTGKVQKQLGAFFLAAMFNLCAQVVGMYVLVEYAGLMPLIAQFVVLGVLAVINFFLYKRFIFKV